MITDMAERILQQYTQAVERSLMTEVRHPVAHYLQSRAVNPTTVGFTTIIATLETNFPPLVVTVARENIPVSGRIRYLPDTREPSLTYVYATPTPKQADEENYSIYRSTSIGTLMHMFFHLPDFTNQPTMINEYIEYSFLEVPNEKKIEIRFAEFIKRLAYHANQTNPVFLALKRGLNAQLFRFPNP